MVAGLRQVIGWAMLRELFGWARELAERPTTGRAIRSEPGVLADRRVRGVAPGRSRRPPSEWSRRASRSPSRPAAPRARSPTRWPPSTCSRTGPEEAARLWLKDDDGATDGARAAGVGCAWPPPTRGDADEALGLARAGPGPGGGAGRAHHRGLLPLRARRAADGHRRRGGRARCSRRGVEIDPPTVAGFAGGLAHITLVTLWQRRGDHDAALGGYRDLVERWWQSGSWTQALDHAAQPRSPARRARARTPPPSWCSPTAAHDPAAPATSDAEGGRLEARPGRARGRARPRGHRGGASIGGQGGAGRASTACCRPA